MTEKEKTMYSGGFSDGLKALKDIVEMFDCIPAELAIEILRRTGKCTDSGICRKVLRDFMAEEDIFFAGENNEYVSLYRRKSILPEGLYIQALWVYSKYAGEAAGNINRAKYPARVIFEDKNGIIWRITVLEDMSFTELKALKNMPSYEGVNEIIVSSVCGLEDIPSKLYPEGMFKFVMLKAADDEFNEKPYMKVFKVD